MTRTGFLSFISLVCCALLPAASLAGGIEVKILNAETGRPVKEAHLFLLNPGRMLVSDAEGRVEMSGLNPGTYRLVVRHVAFEPTDTLEVDLQSGREELRIRLRPHSWVVDEVVITGTRSPHLLADVPVQTEVIGQTEFRRTAAQTVDEALAWATGVAVQEDMSGQGATMRGIDRDRVLILVDGERAVGRVRGSIDLSQYALTTVDRIEVVKGIGSTLYGSMAMGGVINIISRRPEEMNSRARLSMEYGTHRSFNPSADVTLNRGDTSLDLGAKFSSTEGFDLDPSTPHTNGKEAVDRWNFSSRLNNSLGKDWSWSVSGRFMDETKEWLESEMVGGSQLFVYEDVERNKRYDGSTSLEFRPSDRYRMNLRVYGTYYDHTWEKTRQSSGRQVDLSETEDLFLEASYWANSTLSQSRVLTYGMDWNMQDLTSSELSTESEADQAWDGYVQYEYTPHGRIILLPGLRYENHSSFGGQLNPSLNVMVRPHPQYKIRAHLARGFRAPSIKEQFFIFDHTAAGYIVYGGSVNLPEDLETEPGAFQPLNEENSINSSLSFELSYGSVGMHRLTLFYNHLEDLIDFTLIGFTPTYWRGIYVYQNIDTAITKGLEWESRIKLGDQMDLSFSYDYLETLDLEDGGELLNRPNHTFKLVLSGSWERYGLGGSVWGTYTSDKLWVSVSNTGGNEGDAVRAPERTTINMSGSKRFAQDLEFFLRMENLLDETNVTYGYWPGFQIFAGLRYETALFD